jgi:hypothetical protein
MAEKRGDIGKLSYDFPTHGVLEVCMKGTFYRATSKEFRSFDGERRITMPKNQPRIGEDFTNIEVMTFPYDGPVFMYGTNRKVPFTGTESIVRVPEVKTKKSKKK